MFVTTIKHAKQVLSVFLAFLLICQSAVAAGQKTKYELGLEAATGNKWDIAIKYFKAVTEDDPQYKDARKQIVVAQEEQEKALAKSKFQNKFKQETDKCRDLFHIERSPETQRCIERVNELHREGNEKYGSLQLASYETLTADYHPYKTINDVTERVRGIAMDVNGIDNAGSDLAFIESFMADPQMPVDAKVIGAIVGTQIFKGATLAFSQACQDARDGTDQNAADIICNRQQVALGKYASFRNFVVDNSPALTGKSVPLMIWNDYNPLSQTVSALPHPDAMVVANTKNANPNSNAPRIGATGHDGTKTIPVQAVEEKSASWIPYAAIGGVVGVLAIVVTMWKKSTAKPVVAEATTKAPITSPAKASSPSIKTGTTKVASPLKDATNRQSLATTVASGVSSAVSVAQSPEVAEVKKLIADWVSGAAVPKANDLNLKALVHYCAKLGVDILQTGQPKSAVLSATLSAPDSVNPLAKTIMELVLQARR